MLLWKEGRAHPTWDDLGGSPTPGTPRREHCRQPRPTVKPVDVAAEPRCPPRASGGCLRRWRRTRHRFHENRSEIAHDIARLARIIASRRVRRSVAVEVSAERSGRAITANQVIDGKRVEVQRRRPFAVFIG